MPEEDRLAGIWQVIERLMGENGCPWDKKQTPASMMRHLLEEVYELKDAVAAEDDDAICEELGDVLFQVVFVAYLFQKKGRFRLEDALQRIETKLIRRHPHVFGEEEIHSAEAVEVRWAEIKAAERKERNTSLLASIPRSLPALTRALRVSERAAGAGFEWEDVDGVWEKVDEEMAEYREAAAIPDNGAATALEFGDILFSLVNVARFSGIHPEHALGDMVDKFTRRFTSMEEALAKEGKTPETAQRDALERLWEAAKREEGKGDT